MNTAQSDILQTALTIDTEQFGLHNPVNAFLGPATAHWFPVTLTTAAQLRHYLNHLQQTPPAWLIICDAAKNDRPAVQGSHFTTQTAIPEIELRNSLHAHFPRWFNRSTSEHASIISKNNNGIMLRGRPGSGKSSLMQALVSRYGFSLVADDAPDIYRINDSLLASCPPSLYRRYIIGQSNEQQMDEQYCLWHSNIKMSIYLGTKNIQNRADVHLRPNTWYELLGMRIPEWVLQPDTIDDWALIIHRLTESQYPPQFSGKSEHLHY